MKLPYLFFCLNPPDSSGRQSERAFLDECALVKVATFRRISKIAKRDYLLRHICLSVRLSEWNNSSPT
jgi:hypothetical protein